MFVLSHWQGQGTGANGAQVIQLGDISIVFLLINQFSRFELVLAFGFLQKDLRVVDSSFRLEKGDCRVLTPF